LNKNPKHRKKRINETHTLTNITATRRTRPTIIVRRIIIISPVHVV